MICVIALIIYSILGIFSVKWRSLAKEAFDCTFKMITLRPCDTKFEDRIKIKIVVKLLKIPLLARFVYRHFKFVSVIFTILFFSSLGFFIYTIISLILYGSCGLPIQSGCV